MPTAGRLAGAIFFGLFAWYLATITVPFFPEQRPPFFWTPVSVALGVFIGWKVCGVRAGRGFSQSTGIGLTAGPLLAFCMIFSLAFDRMINNAMRLRYDGPTEAIVATFALMAEHALEFNNLSLILTVIIGGLVCAWATELVGQRLP